MKQNLREGLLHSLDNIILQVLYLGYLNIFVYYVYSVHFLNS